MVPLFKPKEAHEFMKKWIFNEDWLPYNQNNQNTVIQ